MSDAPDPRDLDLARRLDAGQAPDGSDSLHAALDAAQPLATPVAPEASARLWDAIARDTGIAPEARPRTAPDRAPRRPARLPRWVGIAAVTVLALGLASWWALDWARDEIPVTVATASGEMETWTGPDGSTVTLRPKSFLMRHGDDRTYKLSGEAFFDVASDPRHPFTIETLVGDVRVLGTRFNVSTWGGGTWVYVEEGRVEVTDRTETLILNAGEGAAITVDGVEPLAAPEAETFTDWQRGEAVFSRETVRRVAQELEHHFSIGVRLPDDVARETVSGVVALDSAPEALDQLGRILGGEFRREGTAYRFVRP